MKLTFIFLAVKKLKEVSKSQLLLLYLSMLQFEENSFFNKFFIRTNLLHGGIHSDNSN
jgi:hypothetical protein